MNILQIQDISKRYGSHQALENVSFDIPQNSVLGLLGPNGAGKTTLIRIITQIIMADKGEVIFQGKKMTPSDVRKIGYLPEERGLYKKMKVADHLLYLAQLKDMKKPDAVSAINHWLDKMDMRSWINKKVEDLSKGMQQKVQFVASVVHNPTLLILDEPFSGFDPVNAETIKKELHELNQKGATIIYSSHRMDAVEELCDYITLINRSQLVLNGTKTDIQNKYRTGTYSIRFEGQNIIDLGQSFETLSVKHSDDSTEMIVKLGAQDSTNDLIQKVSKQSNIISFQEKVPSMNEIFIQTVTESNHA